MRCPSRRSTLPNGASDDFVSSMDGLVTKCGNEHGPRAVVAIRARRMNGQFMKLFRPLITTIVCLVAAVIANAGEQPNAAGKSASSQPIAVELKPLQGKWEGVMVGHEKDGRITITITGDSLHFHRDTNFWFETTMAVPAGKNPKQLHATIKACPRSQADSIGQVVVAIFKIEDGTMTLATGNGDGEAPKSFEATGLNRYELRKVQTQKKNIQPPKTK